MKQEKNYKASVVVGSEVFCRLFKWYHVCFILSLSICTIFGHSCACAVFIIIIISTANDPPQEGSCTTSGSTAWTVSHKTGSSITVHWSTAVQKKRRKKRNLLVLVVAKREFFMLMLKSEKVWLLQREKHHLFEAEVCGLDLYFNSSQWMELPKWFEHLFPGNI